MAHDSGDERSRRSILKSGAVAGVVGATGLAGCSGDGGDGGDGSDGSDGEDGGDGMDGDDGTPGDTAEPTPEGQLPTGGTLTVGWDQTLQSMSPYSGLQADFLAKETMYDRLTWVDRDFEVHPNLAEEWESNDDATVWTFSLREGATFANTDGTEVTAEDVVATADFMRSDACEGCESDLPGVTDVTAVDEYTVEFTLEGTDTEFPRRICETGSTFCIAPKSILEDDPSQVEDTDYGSGPYTLTEWSQGDSITFEANPDYHRTGPDDQSLPYPDEMVWDIIPDGISRVNALSDGRVDCLNRLPKRLIGRAESDTNVPTRASGLQLPIILNTTIEPFANPDVREAIKYGIDREGLLAAIDGRGVLGHHDSITPIHKYYDDSLEPGDTFGTTADAEMAQQKLSDAGYGDGLELPTLYYDDGVPEKQPIAQLFQQQMQAIGIEFDIQGLTESTWLSDHWNQDDTWYISNWSTRVVDSTIPLLAQHSSGAWNTPRWSNDDYDAALDAATSATDVDTRQEQLAECQRISHQEGPWVSTVYVQIAGAHNDGVENYRLYPSIIKDFLQSVAIEN